MSRMVVTYSLVYQPGHEVELCADCAERDDHECGSLGQVLHGAHRGYCEGANHQRASAMESASAS